MEFMIRRDEPGLSATFGDGRQALLAFRKAPSPTRSHEWRKSVKYSWHHMELLQTTAPSLLTPMGECLHDLSDALGDAHNRLFAMKWGA